MNDSKDFDDMEFEEGEIEFETITLTDDEGEDVSFIILDETEYNGAQYLLLVEEDCFDADEMESTIVKYVNDDTIEFVEDDAEFEALYKIFKNNNQDFDM